MKRSKLVTLVGLSVLLVGCGSTNKATDAGKTSDAPVASDATDKEDHSSLKTTITLGIANAQQTFIKNTAEKFLADNGYTNVTVAIVEVAEDKATSITDFTADTAPDIYNYASDQTGSLYAKGALAEVPTVYSTAMKADMGDASANAGKLGSSYYGYPYAGDNGYFLYYNKDYVSETQKDSVEGILEAAQAANMKFAYALDTGSSFFAIGTFMTFGARYEVNLNKDGTFKSAGSDFDGDNGILGGKAVKSLLDSELVDTTNDGARSKAPTQANNFVAAVEGSWNYASFKESLGDKMGVAKLPTITVDGNTANLCSFLGYKLYGVNPNKSADNPERLALLHTLANYLVSAKVQEERFDALSIVPTNTTVKALDKVQSSPLVKALGDQAAYSVAQTVVPSNIWTGSDTAVAALKLEGADVSTVMKTYADTIAASTTY